MNYYKIVKDDYIESIGIGNSGTKIAETEYNHIFDVIHSRPEITETTDYRLKEDLTWEEYEVPPIPEWEGVI